MSKLTIVVFSLLGLISACVGQGILQTGQCDTTVPVVTDFVLNNYLGVWYDIESFPSSFQSGTCNTATYSLTNNVFTIQNTQVSASGLLESVSGTATAQSGIPNGHAKFDVLISGNTPAVPYWVLDTDYTTFALVYSCRNVNAVTRQVNSWKLGRAKGPLPAAATARINAIIPTVAALSAAANQYIPRDHSADACSYFVELAGQCSTTLTGAANFDASAFQGTWYEFARYRQSSQTGQCNRAEYEVGANGIVNVRNSQVISQSLHTISGVAFAVTGRPGVLQVNFNVGTELRSQNLVVLATDNNNYALLYSCTNIEGNRRRISSWQLRKQLTALDNTYITIINQAIAANNDLELAAYQPTSQADASCFYYPEWDQLPATIDLPGPCDTTITGTSAFNAAAFLGTWYEVARYPQPTQAGQCNRAVYGAGTGGGITVQNSQVTAEALSTIPGQATAVAGQNGVLSVTLTTSSGPVTQTLVVLATDNINYALLYSCTNIEGNRRRVGSWKMSKQPGPLSQAANATVNSVIEATEGLKESYYQPTSQTDAACFYYPVWDTLPATIELPGSCDTTITGTSAFNAGAFLGTWYEIARYPQPTQAGQCNRAVYGSGTGGVITVQNSQVIAETLSTIPGQATAVAGQTGVLQVTLTTSSGPVTQTLVVLATDNTNYALLYSCTNIEGNRRRVGSWRLSKQLVPLTAAANATIDNVIANTQGLSQSYYQTTSQAPDTCFYYPATQAAEKVILPGQCDTTISGQANINITRFATETWYHIQRYDQVGNRTCIGTRLSLAESDGANSVVVNSVELIGGVENRTEGTAQLTSAASGQFSLTWSGLEATTITVIRTDYDNYAIAYTCANSSANRQVGVWLLSRQRAWPVAGVEALASLVAERQEFTLREGYFKVIPHNDDCPEPSSAFLFKSSIIVIFVCTILQFIW